MPERSHSPAPDGAGRSVLIVEDDAPLRRVLRTALKAQGYSVIEARTMADAASMMLANTPQLVLLDLKLPDGDGLDLLKRLRQWSTVPVIVVSARAEEHVKVEALEMGADDYVTKPFGRKELLARIRVALRRPFETTPTLSIGALEIDLPSGVVRRAGREIELTPIEYRLLVFLAKRVGRVVTHKQLLEGVWSREHASHRDLLRVFVSGLRKKIEDDPARPVMLETVSGVGYRVRE